MQNNYPRQQNQGDAIQSFNTDPQQQAMAGGIQGMTPEVLQALKGLTPEQRTAFFADYQGQGDSLQAQYEEAQGLINTPSAEGIQTQNAGFVASNPLSHIATAGQRIMGHMKAKENVAAKKKLSDTMTGSRAGLANAMLGLGDDIKDTEEIEMENELRNNRRGN